MLAEKQLEVGEFHLFGIRQKVGEFHLFTFRQSSFLKNAHNTVAKNPISNGISGRASMEQTLEQQVCNSNHQKNGTTEERGGARALEIVFGEKGGSHHRILNLFF